MMKKWMAPAAALVLALALTACGAESAPQESAPETPEETAGLTLEYYLEGEAVQVPAAQYMGDGFTISVPTEGWTLDTDEEDGFSSVSWEARENDDVELEVVILTGKTPDEARDWVLAEEDDYALIADEQGGLGGIDPSDGDVLTVRFEEAADAVYALECRYPQEAAEGFGVTLSVMADTFRVAPEE